MSAPMPTAQDTTAIVELVPLMADLGVHRVPIVDDARRPVGIVTQTDLVAALHETDLGRIGQREALPNLPGAGMSNTAVAVRRDSLREAP